jgi:RNA polymerase sigma-70 factor, ECF subfamily
VFEGLRARLFGIAYRMSSSVEDAEDLVQETYLRWLSSDASRIENAEAWLVSVITRLSIDRWRRVATERSQYVGHWLPEPLVTDERLTPEHELERSHELSLGFLLLLEKLSPTERAAFVLREVFEYDYGVIAEAVGKSEAATRQLLHRARERLQGRAPARTPGSQHANGLLQRFLTALERADRDTLLELLSPEVRLTTDSGGKVTAARNTIEGADRVARFFLGLRQKARCPTEQRMLELNGAAAWVTLGDNAIVRSTAVECTPHEITAFYRIVNPDKLKALPDPQALGALLL